MTDINPTEVAQAVTSGESNLSAASALIGDPSKFGRVDQDGTVYVLTPSGEKPVGSYPGKSPEEALAYFVRKFEAVASEVALLAARIKSGAMVPSDAAEAVVKLRETVANLNGVGDLATLAASVEQIPNLIEDHRAAYQERKDIESAVREAKRAASLIVKEKLVAEAESLALSESWKTTSERLKVLLDEWKAAHVSTRQPTPNFGSASHHPETSLISADAPTLQRLNLFSMKLPPKKKKLLSKQKL
jgi:hypothetical protein